MKKIEMTNKKFNRLTVLSLAGVSKEGQRTFLCKCVCGNFTTVRGYQLRNGLTKSCGCLSREKAFKHGMSKTRIYSLWKGIFARCYNKKHASYKHYGGRGLRISKSWENFENFYKDMGCNKKGESIDRIDNNKGYSKENCKWSTYIEQARNRRIRKNSTIFRYFGKSCTCSDIARLTGIPRGTLRDRITVQGMTINEAINKGVKKWTGQGNRWQKRKMMRVLRDQRLGTYSVAKA